MNKIIIIAIVLLFSSVSFAEQPTQAQIAEWQESLGEVTFEFEGFIFYIDGEEISLTQIVETLELAVKHFQMTACIDKSNNVQACPEDEETIKALINKLRRINE